MRCIVCGAEMRSTEVALGESMTDPGSELHGLQCPHCNEVERPPAPSRDGAAPSAEPVPVHAAPPLSVSSQSEQELDECEALLRRAIEMVRAAPRLSRAADPTGGRPEAPAEWAGSLPLHCAPPASDASAGDDGLDECEVLLERAVRMVRSAPPQTPSRSGIAESQSKPAPSLTPSSRPRKSPTGRVVQIQHDAGEAAYVARDVKSGLSVLRHPDVARLRGMCERIGWKVVDGGRPEPADTGREA
jgi:hypothetical protein